MIKINLDKAKEIHKENLRRVRRKEFETLDIEFMRAVELGDTEKQAELAQKKQVLRDLTKAEELETASSVEEIKASWPGKDIFDRPNPYEYSIRETLLNMTLEEEAARQQADPNTP